MYVCIYTSFNHIVAYNIIVYNSINSEIILYMYKKLIILKIMKSKSRNNGKGYIICYPIFHLTFDGLQ